VNGPGGESLGWDAVSWRQAEENVRRLRQRIFAASRAAGCSRAFRACLSRLPGKRAWPVLRGPRRSNAPGLPDETWFGAITRQAIRRGTFTSVRVLIKRIKDYIVHWNEDAKPFEWTATADEILAKVKIVQANVKKLVDNNSK
jgi:hypothetical protein